MIYMVLPEYYWIFLVRNIDVIRSILIWLGDIEIYVPTLQRLKSLGINWQF